MRSSRSVLASLSDIHLLKVKKKIIKLTLNNVPSNLEREETAARVEFISPNRSSRSQPCSPAIGSFGNCGRPQNRGVIISIEIKFYRTSFFESRNPKIALLYIERVWRSFFFLSTLISVLFYAYVCV